MMDLLSKKFELTEVVSVCPACDHPGHAGLQAGGREEGRSAETQVSWSVKYHNTKISKHQEPQNLIIQVYFDTSKY